MSGGGWYDAVKMSAEDYFRVYDMAYATHSRTEALAGALSNEDPAARTAIANRLLDDGANAAGRPGGFSVLHNIVGRKSWDAASDSAQLQRLLEGGADPNRSFEKFGSH